MKQKRRAKRKKKIANGHNQMDALSSILEVNGVNAYEVDVDSVFNPTQTFKQNKNHLLDVIDTFKKDNDSFIKDLEKGLTFIYLPFMSVFFSFWMYFEAIIYCAT